MVDEEHDYWQLSAETVQTLGYQTVMISSNGRLAMLPSFCIGNPSFISSYRIRTGVSKTPLTPTVPKSYYRPFIVRCQNQTSS